MIRGAVLILACAGQAACLTLSCARARAACTHVPTPRVLVPAAMMAGFGAPAKSSSKAKGKKVAKLGVKRQWDRFKDLVSGGAARNPVYARLPGEEWTKVGEVACDESTTVAAAAQLHKRLILEHAVRVAPLLVQRAKELECGYSSTGEPEPALLTKCEPADVASCGFEGMPDASSRYGTLGNLDEVKKMKDVSGPTIA